MARAEAGPRQDADPADDLAWVRAVVHDLRDPLHAAASFLALMQDHAPGLDDAGRHCRDQAARAVDDCLDLVGQTLDWARAPRVESAAIDVSAALADAQRNVAHAGLHVTSGALPVVLADASGLRRVLQNLLANAARHGGPNVQVRGRPSGAGWWVDVDDDGPGLASGLVLFAPFERRPGSPGSGLGLALVRRIVEAHGGRVAAGASPGGGARISFWLPGVGRGESPPALSRKADKGPTPKQQG